MKDVSLSSISESSISFSVRRGPVEQALEIVLFPALRTAHEELLDVRLRSARFTAHRSPFTGVSRQPRTVRPSSLRYVQ